MFVRILVFNFFKLHCLIIQIQFHIRIITANSTTYVKEIHLDLLKTAHTVNACDFTFVIMMQQWRTVTELLMNYSIWAEILKIPVVYFIRLTWDDLMYMMSQMLWLSQLHYSVVMKSKVISVQKSARLTGGVCVFSLLEHMRG